MKYVLAPGCALWLYKQRLVRRLHGALVREFGPMDLLLTCCHHTPPIPSGLRVINICPGCDRRYRENYANPSTISLWELLLRTETFKFPDYAFERMTIIDACPTRDQAGIHLAVRTLAERMNISIVEPVNTKRESTCCGDIFFGNMPTDKVIAQMKEKAEEMPLDDILVYCVSCSEAMFVGGKRPRYLVDLLFGEDTLPHAVDPDKWHEELDEFIEDHRAYEVRQYDVEPG